MKEQVVGQTMILKREQENLLGFEGSQAVERQHDQMRRQETVLAERLDCHLFLGQENPTCQMDEDLPRQEARSQDSPLDACRCEKHQHEQGKQDLESLLMLLLSLMELLMEVEFQQSVRVAIAGDRSNKNLDSFYTRIEMTNVNWNL